jgi:hypothetical protein
MKAIDPQRDWKTLLSYLPEDYETLALEYRVLNTQWPNARVTDAATLLRFILLHVGADLALRQTVATIAKSGGPQVTQVWLHKKMQRAQPYLAALVQRLLTPSATEATPERWAGYEVVCLDGSTVSGPGAEGADARMHAVVRLHDLRICDVLVTSDSVGETLRRFIWQPGQLVIVDRGYANPAGVGWVVDHRADVLVRVNRGSLPLHDEEGKQIDVLGWCRQLPGHRSSERPAQIHHHGPTGTGRKRILTGRLIGVRLPDKEAQEARERVRREYGAATNAEQLEAAEYVVLFTTAPAVRLSAARCVEAYRLRWQIELQWKRWKSLCHFDHLPNYRDDTILSWLTAKVLLGILLDRIGSVTLATASSATSRPLARQPWKLTAILWPMMISALMPIRLAEAAERLPGIADLLDEMDAADRLRQVSAFRDQYYPAESNCHDRCIAPSAN